MHYVGLACYAAMSPHYPFEQWMQITRRIKGSPAMVVVWDTFGSDTTSIKTFMTEFKGRTKLLEIHMSNEAGRRKHNQELCEIAPGLSIHDYDAQLRHHNAELFHEIDVRVSEIREFVKLVDDGSTEFILSTGLEDDLSDQGYMALSARVKHSWPYKLIRSPDGFNRYIGKASLLEWHSDTANGVDIANEDGDTPSIATSKHFLDRNKRSLATFLWRSAHQGKGTPRAKRRFVISDKDVQELGDLLSHY